MLDRQPDAGAAATRNEADGTGTVHTVAKIIENGAGRAVLHAERQTACSSCHAAKGCGVSSLSKLLSAKGITLETGEIPGAVPGDWYVIGIPESALLKAALLVYLVPVAGLVIAAGAASLAGAAEGWVIGWSVAGLAAGLAAARKLALSSRAIAATTPEIIGPLESGMPLASQCVAAR
jgi:sigma-E factor negative regulatory protein RseC